MSPRKREREHETLDSTHARKLSGAKAAEVTFGAARTRPAGARNFTLYILHTITSRRHLLNTNVVI